MDEVEEVYASLIRRLDEAEAEPCLVPRKWLESTCG
jgi:hypothetical protein